MTSRSSAVDSANKEPPTVTVKDLSFKYREGATLALDKLSFSVQRGEIFAVLGPNGGGKTTLFKILSTMHRPSEGEASICGLSIANQAAEVRRRIGVVFQSPSLDKTLTAAENLRHHGHLYGLRGADLEARIKSCLDRVGLSDRASARVKTLSGGMQRRLEVAKGLLHDPQVLILDEPSTGLDPGARLDLWTWLAQLRATMTVLVTTHLMEEAERCDRLLILSQGREVALGTPEQLRKDLGAEILSIKAADTEALASWLREKGHSPQLAHDGLRLEMNEAWTLAAELARAFPSALESVTVGRPTLEDVFIKRTGHRFWAEINKEEKKS
jgi:ABC-2 type transport system ATP-binding protein